ncbi:HutD family protein [Undibacterium sp. TJN25]|uniref:HutD/Ves family protein n=1 Tax=Undibacterium sp. TJN25 TaxID=3413056 RepID=UPI003BF0DCF9
MRLWNAGDCVSMPWKNGGGITTEIAVWPEGAGLDSFGWRISSAAVSASGPFSRFAGIDRSLAVLHDGVLSIRADGGEEFNLTAASEPYCFRGEQQVEALVRYGELTDLNVMTRRGVYSHRLLRLSGQALYALRRTASILLLYCPQDGGEMLYEGAAISIACGDILMLDRDDKSGCVELRCEPQHVFYLIHIADDKE